jgi:predicted HD phosphohydrolase
MTDLTPTPNQLQSWIDKICYPYEQGVGPSLKDKELACLAFKAGADQELEACCLLLDSPDGTSLRNARRPKPPSLKEQALDLLNKHNNGWAPSPKQWQIIRLAVEALSE